MYAKTDSEIPFVICPDKRIGTSTWRCIHRDCDGKHHYYTATTLNAAS